MWLLIFALLVPAQAGISKDKYTDADAEFSISKPADWEFVKTPKAHGLKLKDDTLMNAHNKSVVVFTKNMGKDFFGVKPTVGVERMTLPPKMTPLQWLTEEVKKQAEHNKYYVPGSPAVGTAIDEVTGARAAFVNSTVIQGREVRVYHALYVVPSGNKVFLINMNCNEDLASLYADTFGKIADSIVAKRP